MKKLQLRLSYETLRVLQEEQAQHVNGAAAASVTSRCTSGAVSCVVTPKGCKEAS